MVTADEISRLIEGLINGARRSERIYAANMVRLHSETRPAGEVSRLRKLADAIERGDHEY